MPAPVPTPELTPVPVPKPELEPKPESQPEPGPQPQPECRWKEEAKGVEPVVFKAADRQVTTRHAAFSHCCLPKTGIVDNQVGLLGVGLLIGSGIFFLPKRSRRSTN